MGETSKAKPRRLSEGWYDKYIAGTGIDIGCQTDPIDESFRKWDLIYGDPDATFMEGVEDNTYDTVYASHVLEHLADPVQGVRNWYRITKSGGHLILLVPHRDLYEKRNTLPSNWNFDHKSLWLPDRAEAPDTLCFKDVILEAIPDADIVAYEVLDAGYESNGPGNHPGGEYSIEAIIKKP